MHQEFLHLKRESFLRGKPIAILPQPPYNLEKLKIWRLRKILKFEEWLFTKHQKLFLNINKYLG